MEISLLGRYLPLLLLLPLAGCASAPLAQPCAALGVSDSQRDNRLAAVSGVAIAPGRMLGLAAEAPLRAGEVYLADAVGNRVPGLEPAPIGAEGAYSLAGVPAGHTFFVVASFQDPSGRPARLLTVVGSRPEGAAADLDAATTLAAAAVATRMEGFSAPFEAARWKRAVDATRAAMTDDPGLDFTSRESTLAAITALRSINAALDRELAGLEAAWGATR